MKNPKQITLAAMSLQVIEPDISPKILSYVVFPRFQMLLFLSCCILLLSCDSGDDEVKGTEAWEREIAILKAAVEPYRDFDVASASGYNIDLTGYRTQMGYHYLNAGLLDDQFEIEKPEVLLFAHDAAGNLELLGVEYAVPIADMDNPPPAPEGFTGDEDSWEINTEFNVWTLHVWVMMDNPNGIFIAMNPKLP